jgi:uncharacterized membrane protein
MAGLIFLISAAFIFAVVGVIALLVKTSGQGELLREYGKRIALLEEGMSSFVSGKAPFVGAPSVGAGETGTESAVPAAAPVAADSPGGGAFSWGSPVEVAGDLPPLEEASRDLPPPAPEAAPLQAEPSAASSQADSDGAGEPPSPLAEAVGSFVRGGNLWVSGGVILLIVGFGTLIAYLASRGFFTLEMGIAAAAAAGLAMILGGWFQRRKRRIYFLVLQGGGMGLLYLSVFAAHRFTPWISAPAALLLISLLIPPGVVLAVFQRAQVLAVFAFLGGFAAPLLLSFPVRGGHVFLFSFYGVLAAGVFIISRFRSWSFLNLLAFLCVFGTALRWVMGDYRPSLFWSAQPFLLFYILLFTLLGLKPLGGKRKASPLPADHFVLLGTPFAAALLEWKIFSFVEHGYALVSLGFSAFYLLLALFILKFRREGMELIIRGFLSLAVFLANLAIPLELNPDVTGAIWAAEGALIFLLGLQRNSWPVSLGGLILHGGATAAFLAAFPLSAASPPFRGAPFTGSLIIGAAALVMAVLPGRYRDGEGKNLFAGGAFAPLALTLWGLSWWFLGWFFEFRRVVNGPEETFLVFTLLSSLGFYALARLLPFPLFKLALIPAPAFALYRVLGVVVSRTLAFFPREGSWIFSHNFFNRRGLISWLSFIFLEALLIILEGRKKRDSPGEEKPYSLRTFLVLLTTLILLSSSGRALTREWGLSESWTSLAGLLPLYALLVLIPFFPEPWRFSSFFRKTNLLMLPLGAALGLALWFIATLFIFGSPRPLPFYLPFLNPLDLLEGLCIAVFLFWRLGPSGRPAGPGEAEERPLISGAGLFVIADLAVFFWIIAVISRCLHFYGGVSRSALAGSGGFRISLFAFLGLYGILHIIGGRRIKNRPLWIAGAVMILLDISKFLILDLAGTGAGVRILSFFISGLILLFIGWAAPLPPVLKNREAETPAAGGE